MQIPNLPRHTHGHASGKGRKVLGVHFKCCNVYRYIYKNKEGTAYTGTCPRCGKRVSFPIGTHGTDSRIFEAW
jgi:hypothetical protein